MLYIKLIPKDKTDNTQPKNYIQTFAVNSILQNTLTSSH